MRYGKIKKHLRTILVNHDLTIRELLIRCFFTYPDDLTIRELLLGASLHIRKLFHGFPHFRLKDISIFRPASNLCLKLEHEPA